MQRRVLRDLVFVGCDEVLRAGTLIDVASDDDLPDDVLDLLDGLRARRARAGRGTALLACRWCGRWRWVEDGVEVGPIRAGVRR